MSTLETMSDPISPVNLNMDGGGTRGTLLFDAVHAFSARCIAIVSALLVSMMTARALGPSGRGDYFLVVTFAALISQISNFGLHSSNTYLVAKDRSIFSRLFINTIWISLVAGTCSSLIGLVLIKYTHLIAARNAGTLSFSIGLVPASLFFVLGCSLLVGIGEIKKFNKIQIAAYGLLALCVGVAAAFHFGVFGFLACTLVGWLVTAALLAMSLHVPQGSVWFDPRTFVKGWRYSAKAYTAALLGLMVLRSNVFLLKFLCGSREVGYYSIAAQMADALGVLPVAVGTVLFPRLVTDADTAWEITKRTAIIVASIMLTLCVASLFLAGPFIRITYGTAFLPATPVVLYMLPGAMLFSIISIVSQFLSAQGFPRAQVLIWFVSFVLNVVISGFFISRASIVGAAIGMSATYGVTFVLIICLAFKVKHNASRARYALA